MMQSPPKKTLSLREFRTKQKEGYLFLVSNGIEAKIRPVGIELFLSMESIPDVLTSIVQDEVQPGARDVRAASEKFKEYVKMLNTFVKACFIEPQVVDEVTNEDTQLSVNEIPFYDKVALFGLITSPVRALESFCRESFRDVATVDDAKIDRGASQPADGNGDMGREEIGDAGSLDSVAV